MKHTLLIYILVLFSFSTKATAVEEKTVVYNYTGIHPEFLNGYLFFEAGQNFGASLTDSFFSIRSQWDQSLCVVGTVTKKRLADPIQRIRITYKNLPENEIQFSIFTETINSLHDFSYQSKLDHPICEKGYVAKHVEMGCYFGQMMIVSGQLDHADSEVVFHADNEGLKSALSSQSSFLVGKTVLEHFFSGSDGLPECRSSLVDCMKASLTKCTQSEESNGRVMFSEGINDISLSTVLVPYSDFQLKTTVEQN